MHTLLLCLPQGASRIAADEGNGAAVIGLEVTCRKPGDQSKSRFPWLRRKGGKGVRGRVWADNSSQHRSPLQVDPSQQEAEAGMRSARLHRSHVRAPHRALPALPLPSAYATKSPNSPSSARATPTALPAHHWSTLPTATRPLHPHHCTFYGERGPGVRGRGSGWTRGTQAGLGSGARSAGHPGVSCTGWEGSPDPGSTQRPVTRRDTGLVTPHCGDTSPGHSLDI